MSSESNQDRTDDQNESTGASYDGAADGSGSDLGHEVAFSIDGQHYTTCDRRQPARDLLILAGLDPAMFDLGEIGRPGRTRRYSDDETVKIRAGTRFVSIRECADVA